MVAACAAWLSFFSAAAADGNLFQLSGYGSFDLSSGYNLYGARYNKEPCYWTYVEVNLTAGKFGSVGASLWQNADMTARRKATMCRMNEWDWSVYYRAGYSFSDDWNLQGEVGHLWYVFPGIDGPLVSSCLSDKEIYGRLRLQNPYVTPYVDWCYDYDLFPGAIFLSGIFREFALPGGFALTPDLMVGGGTKNLIACLYPPYDDRIGGGLTFAQVSVLLSYRFNQFFGVHARLAFVTILDEEIREAIDDDDGDLANDFVWGTIGVDFAF